jgi:hypothetical protein
MRFRGMVTVVLAACLLAGCAQPNRRMQAGKPIEVNRGFCFVHTKYKQDGQEVNWDDTTRKLARYEDSGPHVSAGNSWAIGSIAAAVVATPALMVGSWAKRDVIDMDDDASTALLAGGIVVGVGGIVMCVISDGQYATAGDVYNERLTRTERRGSDEKAYEDAESVE